MPPHSSQLARLPGATRLAALLWTILTAALFGSRAQNASSTEQAPCLLSASRHPICTEASHPAALPEQGWIITTPKRISGGHHLQRIISLVGYADCSWPSAQGYTPQDCYIQSRGLVGNPLSPQGSHPIPATWVGHKQSVLAGGARSTGGAP